MRNKEEDLNQLSNKDFLDYLIKELEIQDKPKTIVLLKVKSIQPPLRAHYGRNKMLEVELGGLK